MSKKSMYLLASAVLVYIGAGLIGYSLNGTTGLAVTAGAVSVGFGIAFFGCWFVEL